MKFSVRDSNEFFHWLNIPIILSDAPVHCDVYEKYKMMSDEQITRHGIEWNTEHARHPYEIVQSTDEFAIIV